MDDVRDQDAVTETEEILEVDDLLVEEVSIDFWSELSPDATEMWNRTPKPAQLVWGSGSPSDVACLGLRECLGVLGHAHGVEAAARVQALLCVRLVLAGGLGPGEGDHEDGNNCVQVVRDGLPEVRLRVGRLRAHPVAEAQGLHGDDAGGAQHGPPAVDQLSLAEAVPGASGAVLGMGETPGGHTHRCRLAGTAPSSSGSKPARRESVYQSATTSSQAG